MKRMLLTTLCYIEKGDQYLMLHRVKKEHDINKDKWIGVGGKFEDKESPEDCLFREVREETGLTLTSWKFRGIITFVTDRYETEFMHLYTADDWEGEMIECNEGNLEWLDKKEVFNLKVWEGDKIFFWLMQHDAPFFSLRLEYVACITINSIRDRICIRNFWIRMKNKNQKGYCMKSFSYGSLFV